MLKDARTTYRGENGEVRKSFRVDRSEIKVWKEENGNGTEVTYLEVPVSSGSQDRDGDAFAEEGLNSQIEQIQRGEVGMWLDHGLSSETGFPDYRVLEQIGGWKDAEIDDDGVLRATAALRPSSEDAQELETMLDEGVAPVGFSVGFIVEEDGEREDIPGKEFREIDLLEISAVGIPSNPDAMVSDSATAMAKAVSEATEYDGESDELARSIQREFRNLASGRDRQQEKTMHEKDASDVLSIIEAYLDAGGDPSDTLDELLEWVNENDGDTEAVEDAIGSLLESGATDAEDPTEVELETLETYLDTDSDGEEDEDEDEEEESESDSDDDEDEEEENSETPEETDSENGGEERSVSEELRALVKGDEEFRSEFKDLIREVLGETEELELSVSLSEDGREELAADVRSELFDGEDAPESKEPTGRISTYENSGDDDESDKSNGGSGNSRRKPSPDI